VLPLVTVVIPAYNHARFVAKAIESVVAQTYRRLELVIIDDGSDDGTPEVISRSLAGVPFPSRFKTRENRGAPATLNEGAALAQGQYVAFLNSDDWYAPDRIACMVDEIARTNASWGFSLVSGATEASADDPREKKVHLDILQKQRNFLGTHPNSFTLVQYNVSVSSGNLFVERDFFSSLGGFRDYRYNHDWDFCLRASAVAEPVIVYRPLYFYRMHGGKTISESREATTADADRVLRSFLADVLSTTAPATNVLGPHWQGNRTLLLKLVFGGGEAALVPIPVLRSLAAEWRAKPLPGVNPKRATSAEEGLRKTAVIVLGMHRSGTSALARVLNLCGAVLPAKVKPRKLGVNPKGFWEPEAVLDLNVRVMRHLGGDWNHVNFSLPGSGAFVEEFRADACALLQSEYGDRETILIKDPRICVLAPLWHEALIAAGYRPVYVVPIRNPLEVARSLHARGDMTVSEGLSLWLAYMTRVEEFADTHLEVLHVRFSDLLDDWRGVVARIEDGLGVSLDAGGQAAEVDTFLEQSLRRQTAGDDELDAVASEATIDQVRALYRTCLARCDQDAGAARALVGGSAPSSAGETSRAEDSPATVSFVLCIENNSIRDQALLLCESIRRYAGRYRQSRILAFAPRPGLGVDGATRRALQDLGVEYVDELLNTTCQEYAPANRVFAGASSGEPRTMPVLIPLWQQGNAPPLFLIHGRHGQAFVSPHFMRLLGNDQPVRAFQARGLDGLHEPHPTVEDMAADYLAAMRKQRPHGPYFLGSLCAGAYIAAVMARALHDAGETVLPLLLLDPPESLLHRGYSTMTEEAFVRKMKKRRAVGGSTGPEDDPAYMQAVRRTAMAFEHAIAHHHPQPYDGAVYMLGSRQRGSDPAPLRKIFTGSLKRFEVGTTHAKALNPKNPVFANYLLRCVGLIRQAAQVA
jgi:thioesterase domain-containing protein/GT2 family glycosyltransferase